MTTLRPLLILAVLVPLPSSAAKLQAQSPLVEQLDSVAGERVRVFASGLPEPQVTGTVPLHPSDAMPPKSALSRPEGG